MFILKHFFLTCTQSVQTCWLDTASGAGKMNRFRGKRVVSDFVRTKQVFFFFSICSESNESWVSPQTPAKQTDSCRSPVQWLYFFFFFSLFIAKCYSQPYVMLCHHLCNIHCSLQEVYITFHFTSHRYVSYSCVKYIIPGIINVAFLQYFRLVFMLIISYIFCLVYVWKKKKTKKMIYFS